MTNTIDYTQTEPPTEIFEQLSPMVATLITEDGGVRGLSAGTLDPFVTSCPEWCDRRGAHHMTSQAADRIHYGRTSCVPLSLEPATFEEGPGGQAYYPASADVYLSQPYREVAPKIRLGLGETERGFTLTVTEAEYLASSLLNLVTAAKLARTVTEFAQTQASR